MALWTLFDKTTSTIIKEHQATPGTADGSLPVGLDPSLSWLVESTAPEPVFDADAERLQATEQIAIDPNDTRTGTRIYTFTKIALSASQLDQKAVDAQRKRLKASVVAAAEKVRQDENITLDELVTIVQELVLRDRLDVDV